MSHSDGHNKGRVAITICSDFHCTVCITTVKPVHNWISSKNWQGFYYLSVATRDYLLISSTCKNCQYIWIFLLQEIDPVLYRWHTTWPLISDNAGYLVCTKSILYFSCCRKCVKQVNNLCSIQLMQPWDSIVKHNSSCVKQQELGFIIQYYGISTEVLLGNVASCSWLP